MNARPPKSSPRSRGAKHRSSRERDEREPQTREERKRRTREALLDAALRLLEDRGFTGLSLREVTREAGVVPGAFYRHFDSMDELGLALIDGSFRTLSEMLRSARAERLEFDHVIRQSIEILVRNVREHPLHFRFIVRERSSGNTVVRYAIRQEVRLIASELAIDLARFPGLEAWNTGDLQLLAGLIVDTAVNTAEALVDIGPDDDLAEVARLAEKRLRMVIVGAVGWRSG